jgi:hypothetical protein
VKNFWRWERDPAAPPPTPPPPPPVTEEDELLGIGPVELGERAETLLRDPLLRAAFARVRADLQVRWLTSKAEERELREQLHQMIVGLDAVERALKVYIGNKKITLERRRHEAA